MSILSAVTVEPVLFLFMLSVFMQYSVFQDLIYLKVCARTFDSSVCSHLYDISNRQSLDFVQNHSSYWILASTLALTVPCIVVSIFLGSWSDIFGRKLPLIIPSCGGILSSIVFICISETDTAPLELVLLGCALSGIFGGFASCIMATMSYVSDVSTSEGRTTRVMVLESMTFLGGTLGPLIGGAMLPATSHAAVFGVILSCHFIIIIYVALILPQVRGSGSSEPRERHGIISGWHLIQVVNTCFKPRENGRRSKILIFLLACVVVMVVSSGEMDVGYLYVKDTPLQWEYTEYSEFVSFKYGVGAVVLLVIAPLLIKSGLAGDVSLCIAGLISRAAGLILLGCASSDLAVWFVPLLAAGSFLSSPALRSMLSKQVEPHELGKVFASLAMLESTCLLLGSVIFNSLYPVLRALHVPGLTFILAAVMLVLPALLIWYSVRRNYQTSQDSEFMDDAITG